MRALLLHTRALSDAARVTLDRARRDRPPNIAERSSEKLVALRAVRRVPVLPSGRAGRCVSTGATSKVQAPDVLDPRPKPNPN